MDSNDVEKVGRYVFCVQRMNGIADVVSKWMKSGVMSVGRSAEVNFNECQAVANSWFDQRDDEALRDEYLSALNTAWHLKRGLDTFLARHAEADLSSFLSRSSAALNAFSDAIEKLDYPGAERDAAALRSDAQTCSALSSRT